MHLNKSLVSLECGLALLALLPLLCGSLRSQGFEEGFIRSSDEAELYFRKIGSGPATVILPARLFAFEEFRWLAGEGFTLISYDMRNRGRSDAVSEAHRLTIEADVADLEAVRAHFRVEKFVPIGYSYLGMMVVLYALDHPQRVERIVQLGPVPIAFNTEFPADQRATFEPDPERLAAIRQRRERNEHVTDPQDYCRDEWDFLLRPMLVGDPARVDSLPTGAFICAMPNEWPINLARHLEHQFVGSVQKMEIDRARLAALDVPVLTIHGKLDRNAPYGAGREWVRTLGDARLFTLENGAHNSFSEFPKEVRYALRVFLAGQWPEGAQRLK